MNVLQKVRILGDAGKWDSCASSSSGRKVQTDDRIGNASSCGICHSFTENGRCISLFKTLMTNSCSFDCRYCQNSSHCDRKATAYQPEELARVFMHLYVRNFVEGLFLSSGIAGDPDRTIELGNTGYSDRLRKEALKLFRKYYHPLLMQLMKRSDFLVVWRERKGLNNLNSNLFL